MAICEKSEIDQKIQNWDPQLLVFLNSSNEVSSQENLSRLFNQFADPVCAKIVHFRTRNLHSLSYGQRKKLCEDLMQEVRLKILSQLRVLQTNPTADPIRDFQSYVARITHNLLHDYLRDHFHSVVITENKKFGSSDSEFENQFETVAENRCELPDFVTELEEKEEGIIRLRTVWHEICQLPKNQSAAWLLKISDQHGQSTLKWLPVYQIATIRQIAEVMGKTPETLATLWNELPLPDKKIAELLKLNQRQVINLRKSANARLQRRLHNLFNKGR